MNILSHLNVQNLFCILERKSKPQAGVLRALCASIVTIKIDIIIFQSFRSFHSAIWTVFRFILLSCWVLFSSGQFYFIPDFALISINQFMTFR